MAGQHDAVLEAIQGAMDAEKKAAAFYRDAVEKTGSQQGKLLLRQLADFEENHFVKLEELKQSLTDKGEFIAYDGTSFGSITGEIPSGSGAALESNLDDVLSIINLAIEAETGAFKRYRDLAQATNDTRGREMFLRLADEEVLHRRILSDEYYHLQNKDGIWMWGD